MRRSMRLVCLLEQRLDQDDRDLVIDRGVLLKVQANACLMCTSSAQYEELVLDKLAAAGNL
jgi:hypothetical protein